MVMPRMAFSSARIKQGRCKPTLLSALQRCTFLYAACLLLLAPSVGYAIPPNTPVTNTATVDYLVGGVAYTGTDSDTVITDANSGNSSPYGISLSPDDVDENVSGGVVGTVLVLDPDPGDVHTFSVSDARFEVVGNTLQLVSTSVLDFETEPTVIVSITGTDPAGAQFVQVVTVRVNDVNEAPTALSLSALTVVANQIGGIVGALTVVDPDVGDSHTYSVDDPRFEIVGGELKLLDAEQLGLGEVVIVQITATDGGGLQFTESFQISAVPPGGGAGNNSGITFYQYTSGGAGTQIFDVATAQCDAGAGLLDLPTPQSVFGGNITVPGTISLGATNILKSGDTLFVQVLDPDGDLDPNTVDRVLITLTTSTDVETVSLAETGENTGLFVGYIQTSAGSSVSNDCRLQASTNDGLVATYTDANDATDSATASLLVDPFGLVFDSATGTPINGAVVSIIQATDNQPAVVFADDGVSTYPATVTSGDATLGFMPGSYRFPFVNAGDYLLQVIAPNRFRFPTLSTDATLQTLPGAPYALGSAARGQIFAVAVGPAVRIDIPLDLQPIVPTSSTLEIFALQGGSSGNAIDVQVSACFDGAGFTDSVAPISLSQGTLSVPGRYNLTNASRFSRGDVVFISVTDQDQDLDPFSPDMIEVDLSVTAVGDNERIRLRETNDSTGVFTGYVQLGGQLGNATATPNNCTIEASAGAALVIRYVDANDAQDESSLSALLDPGFTVISSVDGELLDGASITVIDVSTGLPAVGNLFAADGVTAFPATVVSGGSVLDGNGQAIDYPTGSFYFPVITPGTYRFEVSPLPSYLFPSTVSDTDLQALGAGPFTLSQGSRGDEFVVVAGVPSTFDIPLDPVSIELFVSKQASKEAVAIGDFLQYSISIQNGDNLNVVSNAQVVDTLPIGFRYASGSLRVDQQNLGEPGISANGRQLQISVGDIDPNSTIDVRYVVEVTAGAQLGSARNRATVVGTGIGSVNTAFADVVVREDLMRSTSTLVGQVIEGTCQADTVGMANVRVWLEDGTFVVTDQDGKFHFEGIEPGTHVVQLDTATLPSSHEPISCEQNSQFAGSSISQFVDLQAGTLWRTNFYVNKKPDELGEVVTRLDAEANEGLITYRYRIRGEGLALHKLRATLMLDDQLAYLQGSTRLNGESKPDPTGIELGAPTFRLPNTGDTFDYVLEFQTFVKNPKGMIETKAVTQFDSDAGTNKSAVSVNQLSLGWPSSLVMVAESLDKYSRSKRNNLRARQSSSNEQALRQAQANNARHIAPERLGRNISDGNVGQTQSVNVREMAVKGEVHEPSLGSNRSRSEVGRVPLRVATQSTSNQPYQLPLQDKGKAPKFDGAWLTANQSTMGFAWPPKDYNPVMPAIAVAVVHSSQLKPQLLVDGKLVSPLSFEGSTRNHDLGLTVSRWDAVAISERDSVVEAHMLDANGNTRMKYRRDIHYSSGAAKAVFLPQKSYLVADGVHPPVMAVQLFDRAGFPVRAGSTGEFSVAPPYRPLNKTKALENLSNDFDNQQYRVLRDGVAYIQLEPTTTTGEIEMRFQFSQVRSETLRARIVPGQRDWILVGLIEGSYAKNNLSGDGEVLRLQGLEDETLTDGRVAFYAKGMVKGDWLLTAAYDTDKKFERRLRDQIDPNQFYTLYGDGTNQLYDAESQRKLYLKVEKSRFSALFGNFDTEFQRSELARYERRMNGLNFGYYGERVEVKAFASETDQGFVRDEIQGDGTSGVYRLSRNPIVRNSESLRLVTRDRFATEVVLNETQLTRFSEYTIDYDLGTVIFKQPVFSQDNAFNPIFIEVEYEVAGEGAGEEIVAGTRLSYRLDDADSEVALTYIRDETVGQGGELIGADLTWQFSDIQKLSVEIAQTDTDINGQGRGYLIELEHRAEQMAGRVYLREQEENFGLGHQSLLQAGLRKIGLEGEYRYSEAVLFSTQAFRQTLLDRGSSQDVINAQVEYNLGGVQWLAGLRAVREETQTLQQREAAQLILGAARGFMNNKLVLRSQLELDASGGDSTDYPSRAILGVEYEVVNDVRLIAEQELSWGDVRDTQDTRIGVRARPWKGADINSIVSRQQGENGDRLFATTGVLQQWRLNEHWMFDVGFDRVQTLSSRGVLNDGNNFAFNLAVPPASGGFNEDFTAFYTGVAYQKETWNVSSRVEFHAGDQADKWNFLAGANRQLSEGRVVSSSFSILNQESLNGFTNNAADFRFGLAWRPAASAWTFLNRTDLVFEKRSDASFNTRTRKWVNNFNLNYKPNLAHQVALQLGFKYIVDNIDDQEFSGTTALYGMEYRYNWSAKWDTSVHASALHSLNSNVIDYSAGIALGYNALENTWVSVGYNFVGFEDEDFVAADYTAQGPYLKIRLKIDQDIAKRFLEFAGLGGSRKMQAYANSR